LYEDDSYTTHSSYLMNHCTRCGTKFGDFYLPEAIMEKTAANKGVFPGEKVEISFALTKWEEGKVKNNG